MVVYVNPPPPPLIFKKDILQWNTVTTKLHLSEHLHITYNTIPWLTFFINWWGGGGGGGVKILWYNILTPPLQIFKKGILTLEYSVILALLLRTCKLNMRDNSSPCLTFLIDWGGGGGSIYYGIIY